MTAEANGTACAVPAKLGTVNRGWLALRAWAPPATAIGPLRGQSKRQRLSLFQWLNKQRRLGPDSLTTKQY